MGRKCGFKGLEGIREKVSKSRGNLVGQDEEEIQLHLGLISCCHYTLVTDSLQTPVLSRTLWLWDYRLSSRVKQNYSCSDWSTGEACYCNIPHWFFGFQFINSWWRFYSKKDSTDGTPTNTHLTKSVSVLTYDVINDSVALCQGILIDLNFRILH